MEKFQIGSSKANEKEHQDGRGGKPKSYEMGVQISRGVYSEVPPANVVREVAEVSWCGISPLSQGGSVSTPTSRFEQRTLIKPQALLG